MAGRLLKKYLRQSIIWAEPNGGMVLARQSSWGEINKKNKTTWQTHWETTIAGSRLVGLPWKWSWRYLRAGGDTGARGGHLQCWVMEFRLYYAGVQKGRRGVRRRAMLSRGLWQEIQGRREAGGATNTGWRVPMGVGRQGLLRRGFGCVLSLW